MNIYYKINKNHMEEINKFLNENNIKYNSTEEPVEFICEQYVDKYCNNNYLVNNDLKPLFKILKPHIIENLKNNKSRFLDTDEIYFTIIDSIDNITNILADNGYGDE